MRKVGEKLSQFFFVCGYIFVQNRNFSTLYTLFFIPECKCVMMELDKMEWTAAAHRNGKYTFDND